MTTPGKDLSKRTPERTKPDDEEPADRNPMHNPTGDSPSELDDDEDEDEALDRDRDEDDDEDRVPETVSEEDRETGPIDRGKREPR